MTLTVGIDATPLLGLRTGVGRYVEGLVGGMAALGDPPAVVLAGFSVRGGAPRVRPAPPGARWSRRRVPARALNAAWERWQWPPVEWMTGSISVFHATNFVLPPRRRAAGVVTIHDLAFRRFPDTVNVATLRYRSVVPAAARAADVVIAVSQSVADEIEAEFDVSPEHLVVAPNGVDARWLDADVEGAQRRARLGLPDEFLLFVGNLEPRKNLSVLARAHDLARRSAPHVLPLVLVGPRAWGDPWAGAPEPGAGIVQTGFISDDDLMAVVAGARAVCMPSVYEGFGLPVLEAFARGTAVIASDIAAHREIAGGLATLIGTADVDAWAEAMLKASTLDDEPDAAAARQHHARSFTWERSARIHLDAYRRAARS